MTIGANKSNQHYARLRVSLDMVESIQMGNPIKLTRKGHVFQRWKIGQRVVLCDTTFGLDRVKVRLVEKRYYCIPDWKVYTDIVLEPLSKS